MKIIAVYIFFFSGLISQLLKLSIYCDDLHLLKMYFPQYKYMTFMYSYHKANRVGEGGGNFVHVADRT